MRKVSVHLNYVVWKCSYCGRKEVLWGGANPWSGKRKTAVWELEEEKAEEEVKETVALVDSEELGCYLAEVIEEVLEGKILVGVEQ